MCALEEGERKERRATNEREKIKSKTYRKKKKEEDNAMIIFVKGGVECGARASRFGTHQRSITVANRNGLFTEIKGT